MTGFGRAEVSRSGYRMTIELKSVNHRFFDINIRMPRTLLFLEDDLRNIIKASISRGHIDVFVNFAVTESAPKKITADSSLISAYISALRGLKSGVKLKDDISLSHIMRIPDAIKIEEAPADESLLAGIMSDCAKAAVSELSNAREREGKTLYADMLSRVDTLLDLIATVEGRENIVVNEYREKLTSRIKDFSGAEIDEVRLAQELLIYADRQNITEETVRVRSHVTSFKKEAASDLPAGRKLDFIVQELNREFNTIGSKSADMEITNAVIAGKSEIEKIREQVQNIE